MDDEYTKKLPEIINLIAKTLEVKHYHLCFCGSGKKFKKCCQNKTSNEILWAYINIETLSEAIQREKQIKSWTRVKKENLIKYGHPTKF